MSHLDRIIARLAIELHPDKVRALAAMVSKSTETSAAKALMQEGAGAFANLLHNLGNALQNNPMGPGELAARLQTAAAVAELAAGQATAELVWTGPSSGLVSVRHTEQVVTGLIDGAQNRIFLISFVAYNVLGVLDALARSTSRGVLIHVLLERSQASGGNVTVDSLALLRSKIPKASFYEWDQTVSGDKFSGASVHAKCAVADGKEAFVASANLTGAAMERNMEIGVLLRGGPIPAQLENHLQALVTTKHLKLI